MVNNGVLCFECMLTEPFCFWQLSMVTDEYAEVRGEAIRTITVCLADIQTVPITDANIFPEYILPALVRKTYNI